MTREQLDHLLRSTDPRTCSIDEFEDVGRRLKQHVADHPSLAMHAFCMFCHWANCGFLPGHVRSFTLGNDRASEVWDSLAHSHSPAGQPTRASVTIDGVRYLNAECLRDKHNWIVRLYGLPREDADAFSELGMSRKQIAVGTPAGTFMAIIVSVLRFGGASFTEVHYRCC